tara:strand:- start:59 stop:271 length:213 start_codon:yes stop_codon:yes gene_type:complete
MDYLYYLDYAVGQFVLLNKRTREEIELSEEDAIAKSFEGSVKVLTDARDVINSILEDEPSLHNGFIPRSR